MHLSTLHVLLSASQHEIDGVLDRELIAKAMPALDAKVISAAQYMRCVSRCTQPSWLDAPMHAAVLQESVTIDVDVHNQNRSVCTMLSHYVTKVTDACITF